MKYSIFEVAEWADKFFLGESPVHHTAAKITRALHDLGIPFAVAGMLAANAHGYRCTTDVMDLLLTQAGLAAFKERWLGRGWVEKFPGSKGMKDAENGVKIDVLLTGDFPGDGKPKPVAFPDPAAASELDSKGVSVLTLPVLIQLKLASGMTASHRPGDFADVIQLIRVKALAPEFTDQLDPYVHDKYLELWHAAQIRDEE